MTGDHARIHLEDIEVGLELVSDLRTVEASDIVAFAELSGDRNPLHLDPTGVAEGSPFELAVAHGLLVTSISSGQATEADRWALGIYLEASRRFVAPVVAGDAIRTISRVTDVRRSRSAPDRGIVTLDVRVENQRGQVVQEGTDVVMVGARQGDADGQPRSK